MERPFINRLRIQNYGCIKDATFELTPLHALIGPNDSGKSTVLRALRTMTTWAVTSLGTLGPEGDRLNKAFLEGYPEQPAVLRATVGDTSWQVSAEH